MKNRILRDFYYGNLAPANRRVFQSSEVAKASAELMEAEKQLRTMLTPEALAILERLEQAHVALSAFTEESAFLDGFKAGARLMLGILYDPEEELTNDCKEVDHES